MIFEKLYSILKKEDDLFAELTNMGKEFIKKKEKENYEEYKNMYQLKEYNESDINLPNLAIKTNLICYNNCYFCPNPHTGEYLDLKKTYYLLSKSSGISLTGGGDPLLQPTEDLEAFLEEYKKCKPELGLEIMTSGITVLAPEKMRQRYYSNLEKIYLIGNELSVIICFSYSSSNNMEQRFLDFQNYFKYLRRYHGDLGYFQVDYRILGESEEELEKNFQNFSKLNEIYYSTNIERTGIAKKEDLEIVSLDNKCINVSNDLFIDTFGNFNPCCSMIAEFKHLPIMASLGEPFEEINSKRFIYYGLIAEFQESYKLWQEKKYPSKPLINDNCTICVNEFPRFIERLIEGLEKGNE